MLSKSDTAENAAITKQQEATTLAHTLSTDLHLKQLSVKFSQKSWVHFTTGGELRNLDKRFVLTFPAPACQIDRSLPSLMNSGAEKMVHRHVKRTLILQPRYRRSISGVKAT